MDKVMTLVDSAVTFLSSPIFMGGNYGTLMFWMILGIMGEVAISFFRSMLDS